jgi:type I restriction enzyme S subunit
MASKPPFVGEKVRLFDLCAKGKSTLRQKDLLDDGPYSVYGASGIAGTMESFQNEKPYVCVVKDGAGVGRAMACEAYTSVLGTMQALIPKNGDYLLHLVRSLKLGDGFSGSTIPHIYFKDYGKRAVPNYSSAQQAEIAAVLNLIETLIEQRGSVVRKSDELIKSRFVEMFGNPVSNPKYPKYPIFKLAKLSSGATPNRKKPEYFEGEIPWVKTGEVATGNINETEEHITEEAISDTACHVLPAGTILVAMYGQGDTRGKSALLNISAATNQACAAIKFNDQINEQFALAHLHLCYEDLRNLSYGGNQKNLSLKILKNYEVTVPPIGLQQQFADFVTQVDKSRFVCALASQQCTLAGVSFE